MKNDILKDLNKLIRDISKDNHISLIDAKKIIINALNRDSVKQFNKIELNDYLKQIINNYYLQKDLNIYIENIRCFVIRFKIKKDYEQKRYYKNNRI